MPRNPAGGAMLIAAAAWHDEHPGGANKLPTDFARFLARRGYEVAFLGASSNIEAPSRDVIDGVDVWRYPSPRAASPSLANLHQHWRSVRAITAAVLSERPVSALLGHAPLQYLAAVAACGSGPRRCYAVHSPFVEELKEGAQKPPTLKQRAAWTAAAILERRVLAASHVVHYDSAFTSRLMEATYPKETNGKGVVLPGWVDVTRFRPSTESRVTLRRRLGLPWLPDAPTFFSLRRLEPRMGLDALIGAAHQLAQNGRSFRVIVGGDGPCRSDLETQAAAAGLRDRIAFLGRVPDDRLADCFAAADCFVLPTRALECFGLIVLESLACGVPVIGVPVGSIPEVMGSSLTRWIADDNQAPALARRMEAFLSGDLIADPAAFRARALEFAFDTIAEQHEQILLGSRTERDRRSDPSADASAEARRRA